MDSDKKRSWMTQRETIASLDRGFKGPVLNVYLLEKEKVGRVRGKDEIENLQARCKRLEVCDRYLIGPTKTQSLSFTAA